MNVLRVYLLIIPLFVFVANVSAQSNTLQVSSTVLRGAFPLIDKTVRPSIYIDNNDAKVVSIAANSFANDVQLVSGKQISILNTAPPNGFSIIAGTVGKSKLIGNLIKSKQLDVSDIKNKWECFVIKVVGKRLIIAGSDPRGTAFGIFHLSKLMGVLPGCGGPMQCRKKSSSYLYPELIHQKSHL